MDKSGKIYFRPNATAPSVAGTSMQRSPIIVGRRDTAEPIRRFRQFEVKARAEGEADTGAISFVASTDDPCDWGGWREVLVHNAKDIDVSACRALLLNHNANQIAGTIRSIAFKSGECRMDADVMESARLASGVSVREAIKAGALRGISIGYAYSRSDADYDEETRTVTVRKWRLMEASLTPIPADTGAAIRSLPSEFTTKAPTAKETTPMKKFAKWLSARGFDLDKLTDEQVEHLRTVCDAGKEPADDYAKDARTVVVKPDADEKSRADNAKRDREIVLRAESQGLKGSDYMGLSDEEANRKMLADLAKARASTDPTDPAVAVPGGDQVDKARDQVIGALAHNVGFVGGARFEAMQKNNEMRGRGIQDMIRNYAEAIGMRGAWKWSRTDAAYFALGRPEMMASQGSRSANVTMGSFPSFVFLNALTKILAAGYEQGSRTSRYRQIVSNNQVPDFKPYYIGNLGMGNLQQTAENIAFPELDKSEGVYNNTAKMWGGTLSLSFQAVVSDDLGEFNRSLKMAGAIADKTIDRRVFQKLLMGTSPSEATSTWTSNTTSGGSLVYTTADLAVAARGRVSLVRAALGNKIGQDGNPLGTMPRFCIVPLTREVEAQGIFGPNSPGQLGPNVQQAVSSIEVVATPWLEAAALTGFSTTSYYLLADPNECTGLVLTKIAGLDSIQVQPYDAGAVAALKYKLWLPFEADLHSMSYTPAGSSTAQTTIAAAQQGTT